MLCSRGSSSAETTGTLGGCTFRDAGLAERNVGSRPRDQTPRWLPVSTINADVLTLPRVTYPIDRLFLRWRLVPGPWRHGASYPVDGGTGRVYHLPVFEMLRDVMPCDRDRCCHQSGVSRSRGCVCRVRVIWKPVLSNPDIGFSFPEAAWFYPENGNTFSRSLVIAESRPWFYSNLNTLFAF
jgi:hypothetical protein